MRLWVLKSLIGSDHERGSFSFTTAFQNPTSDKKIPIKKPLPSIFNFTWKYFISGARTCPSPFICPCPSALLKYDLPLLDLPKSIFPVIYLNTSIWTLKCTTPLYPIKIPSQSQLPPSCRSATGSINIQSRILQLQNMAIYWCFSIRIQFP